MKMSWFSLVLLLSLTINNVSEGRKLHSAVVTGTVYCDICSQQDFSKPHHFISGASVAVECENGDSRASFRQEAKTDEHGEFKVRLPFSVTKHVKKIKRCSVKLIQSSEPHCAVASSATSSSSSLHLMSRNKGTHVFSAGFFTFKPLKQPNLCKRTPNAADSKESNTKQTMRFEQPNYPIFPPPLEDPTPQPTPLLPNLPPLPQLPPLLPPLPSLPLLPIPNVPIPGVN